MLAKHISAANRRGRAGALSRKRGLHHRYGGQAQRKRHAHLAANMASANVRIEHAKEVRSKHLRRLDEALRQGGATLQSMLIMSERLTRIGGSEGVAMSPPQATRIRNQCMAVANYFRALDLYYPKLGLLECAGKAAENSGHVAAPWTIYRWSLQFMENGGHFISDGRGDYDHDCFITGNEDIRRKLRNWMRSNLRHLTRAKAAAWVNQVLIPKYVGGGDGPAMVKELKDKYKIDGTVSEYTVGRWMHLAGGEYVVAEKSYYCDSHESAENQAYRKAYLARDQGGVGAPSERELGQFLWIQMTADVAEDFWISSMRTPPTGLPMHCASQRTATSCLASRRASLARTGSSRTRRRRRRSQQLWLRACRARVAVVATQQEQQQPKPGPLRPWRRI